MGRTSTTRKVTKVARTGGGRTKRGGQSSSLFYPGFIVVVVVIGLGLIVQARAQRQPDISPPRIGADHWHSAIGFDLCGNFAPAIPDNNQDPLGIHTHGDGVIHTHPFSSQSAGKNAKLGVYFDAVGAKVTATSIQLPQGEPLKNGDKCGDQPGRVVAKVWPSRAPGTEGEIVTGDPRNIRLGNNQLITIGFLPEGADILKPPSEPQLDRLTDVGPQTATPEDTSGTTTAPTTAPSATAPSSTAPPATAAP